MLKNIFSASIILGLVLSNVNAQNKSIIRTKKNQVNSETKKNQVTGNKFKVDFGHIAFQLHFECAPKLTFAQLTADGWGKPETVHPNMVEVRQNVFLVYWKEKSGTTITHLEDFENETVYTNITSLDHNFTNLKGKLTLITKIWITNKK